MEDTVEIPAITWDEVRAAVAQFEAKHPGLGPTNYDQAFLDDAGTVVRNADFQWIESLYTALEAAPSGASTLGFGGLIGPPARDD